MRHSLSTEFSLGNAVAYPDLTERESRRKLANKGAYILQYGKAFVSHYRSSGSRDFYNGASSGRYREALLYAMGQQDAGQYSPTREDADRIDHLKQRKLDRRLLKILPKYRKAVMGLLKERDYTPSITALDTLGKDEMETYRAAIEAWMYHGEFLQQLGLNPQQAQAPNGQALPSELPLDQDDLDLYLADYKGVGAMRLEVGTAQALAKAVYADQDKQCQQDDIVYGSSVIYLAQAGTKRIPRRLDPGKAMFLPSDTGLYENLQAGAHIESITLGALLAEMEAAGHRPSETELNNLKTLARPASATGQYEYSRELDGMPEAGGTIQVIRFSFLSTDRVVKALASDKMGNPRWVDKSAGWKPNGHYADVQTQDVVNVYEGSLLADDWNVGWGARLAHAQLRDAENPFQAHPFYVVTTPDMIGGLSESLVEQTYPVVDMAAREFMKLQDALSKLPDSAIAINLDLLAEVSLEGGNGKTGDDLIKGYFREGVLLYKGRDEAGNALPPPISQIPIDITQAVLMRQNNIDRCIGLLQEITGANGAVAGANAAPDQGKGTTELAIQGSQNTLEFLFYAKQTRFERVCRAIAANLKANDPELAARTMQVKVEQKPTQQDWMQFYQNLANYIATGQITAADEAAVRDIDNLKEARRFLASRAKRKRRQDQEDAQKNTDYATQQQTASAEATEQFKQQTLQMEFSLQMQKAAFDRETQWGSLERQGQNALQAAQITTEGRVRGVEMTVEGANQREVLKQQNAAALLDDKLESAEYTAEMQAEAAAKRPAAGK